MKKIIIFLFLLLLSLQVYADDLRISMGNSSGNSQNVYVKIEDKGTAEGGAKYDKETQSIINTSDGTCISIGNVDFGSGRYGLYSHILIEYTCSSPVSNGFFDVFLGNTTTPIASIPVEKTDNGVLKEGSSTMNVNVVGVHRLYVRWRGHSASIKTFGGYEQKPFAQVKVVRTGSPLNYKYSYTKLKDIEGVHNVKMVWKNQNANVHAVYLDKAGGTSIDNPIKQMEDVYKVYSREGSVYIESKSTIGNITIYSLMGNQIYRSFSQQESLSLQLEEGIYLLKLVNNSGETDVRKVIVK